MTMKNTEAFRRNFAAQNCSGCPSEGLVRVIADSDPVTFDDRIDVLFIGVNPGAQEAVQGIPFCGPAGQLLREVAERILRGRTKAFTNVMFCSTGNQSYIREPERCFSHCRENLRSVCRFFSPKIYVPCGNHAMTSLGVAEGGISANNGRVFRKGRFTFIPCLHPSAVLRGFSSQSALERAMQSIKHVLDTTCQA